MKFEKIVLKKAIFTITTGGEDGNGLLWWIDDGEFRYTHLFQFGIVTGQDIWGVQLVLGPILFFLAGPHPTAVAPDAERKVKLNLENVLNRR